MFEKVCLIRGNQRIVFQSMVHAGDEQKFASLQAEVNELRNAGYGLIIEKCVGVGTIPPGLNKEEIRIAQWSKILMDYQESCAEKFGFHLQSEGIDYDLEDVVIADATFPELIHMLYGKGVRVSEWVLVLMRTLFYKSLLEKVLRRNFTDPKVKPFGFMDKINTLVFQIFWGPLELGCKGKINDPDIYITHRNGIAVQKIEEYFSARAGGKALVHYGEAHKPGIVQKLKAVGWSIEQCK